MLEADVAVRQGGFTLEARFTAPGDGITALFGPSGAGKTSLLLVVAGLLALRSGTGTVLGVDLNADGRAVRRQVGLLGHHLMGYPELSATENVTFGLRAQRRPAADAAPALARVGLEGRLATVPSRSLSMCAISCSPGGVSRHA